MARVIPSGVISTFTGKSVLRILFFSVLFNINLTTLNRGNGVIVRFLSGLSLIFFGVVNCMVGTTPLKTFKTVTCAVKRFKLTSLIPLNGLVVSICIAVFLFVFIILGVVYGVCKFDL